MVYPHGRRSWQPLEEGQVKQQEARQPLETVAEMSAVIWRGVLTASHPAPPLALSAGRMWDRQGWDFKMRVHSPTLAAEHVAVQKCLGDLGRYWKGFGLWNSQGFSCPWWMEMIVDSHAERSLLMWAGQGKLASLRRKEIRLFCQFWKRRAQGKKNTLFWPLLSKTREIWEKQLKAGAPAKQDLTAWEHVTGGEEIDGFGLRCVRELVCVNPT